MSAPHYGSVRSLNCSLADPYPYAVDECFDAYRSLVDSGGQIVGMSGHKLNIILSGDSA